MISSFPIRFFSLATDKPMDGRHGYGTAHTKKYNIERKLSKERI